MQAFQGWGYSSGSRETRGESEAERRAILMEHATAIGSHNRGKKVWKQHLRDKQNQQRGHGDTTCQCGPRRATGCETVSLPLAKARTMLAALEQ
jgi:hypothetical protein